MDHILARLRLNQARTSTPASNVPTEPRKGTKKINNLLTSLDGQNQMLHKERVCLMDESDPDGPEDERHTPGSDFYTPATESLHIISSRDNTESDTSHLEDATEILRVKQELAAAKLMISRQEHELAETRKLKHTMEQAMGPPSEADFAHNN